MHHVVWRGSRGNKPRFNAYDASPCVSGSKASLGSGAGCGRGGSRDEQLQSPRDDAELHRKPRQRFAVHLGVNGTCIKWLADETVGFPEVDTIRLTQIAEPERWQVAQILEAALRGQCQQFELILIEVRAGGDLERPAVMFGAADHDQGSVQAFFGCLHSEAREFVAEYFAGALPPVGKDSEARFQFEIDRIGDLAVGPGAGDAEKIAALFGAIEGSCQAERQFTNFAANELLGSATDVPGQVQFLREHVGSAGWKERKGYAVAVLLHSQAVYDFVDSAVAPAGDHKLAACLTGIRCQLSGFARGRSLRQSDLDAFLRENAAGFLELLAPCITAPTGIGIVDQKRAL